jgi:hypothetical protein
MVKEMGISAALFTFAIAVGLTQATSLVERPNPA